MAGKQQIKVIIFDLGNVVLKFDIGIIAKKIAAKHNLNEHELFEFFFDSPLTQIHDEGKIDAKEFFKRVRASLNINMSFRQFKAIWSDIFTENKEIIDLLGVLFKSKKYKIYLMSNTNKMHFDYIKKRFKIIKEFDRIFTSYGVGERKPHPKIYLAAIKVAKTGPHNIIFTDDRKELTDAAKEFGIRGIHFRNAAQLKRDLEKHGIKPHLN